MSSRGTVISPRGFIERFRPMPGGVMPGLMPPFRAFKTWEQGMLRPIRPLGRLGSLEVRLARKPGEIRRAQKLRYRVFYQQGSAVADARIFFTRRDIDAFDRICDHLLVIDHGHWGERLGHPSAVVGTYRLLRQEVAERHHGFYTAGEFAIDDLIARHSDLRFLELGRSCVLPPYRNK